MENLEDSNGAADHSHTTAKGDRARGGWRKGNGLQAAFQWAHDIEAGDREHARAAACAGAIHCPPDRSARFHREDTRFIATGCHPHENLLRTIRIHCGKRSIRDPPSPEYREIDPGERESALQVKEREEKDKCAGEAEEEAGSCSFRLLGKE